MIKSWNATKGKRGVRGELHFWKCLIFILKQAVNQLPDIFLLDQYKL